MIISKVRLRRSPGAQGTLAKILLGGSAGDRGHGLVWSLFSATGEEDRDFLFREAEPGSFMVVSKRPPSDPHELWEIASKHYAPALVSGQKLGFVLRANPAIAVKTPGKTRGLRVDAIMHAKAKRPIGQRATVDAAEVALRWLFDRAHALGVAFDGERCFAGGYRQVRIPCGKRGDAITFSEVDYEGVLTVTDPSKLANALFGGIGKAKAYGCGLLLVRPAHGGTR